jgi:hypothetical protein
MSSFDEYKNRYKTARMERRNGVLLRYTRLLFTEYLRRQMHDLLGYGLAMESLALFEKPEAPPAPDRR